MSKKIAMVIAPGMFRDEEYSIPLQIFKKQGYEVKTACTTLSIVEGKLGLKVKPDILLNKVTPDTFDAVVFVGGPGVKEYWEHQTAHKIAKDFFQSGKLLTAICSAPVILAKAGIIKDKRVTSYPGDEFEMVKSGCIYTGNTTEIDKNIITGNGPQAAKEFAEKIIAELKK
jgi:protease I